MFKLPKCRHCHRFWIPALGVVASDSYCRKCRVERKRIAKKVLGLRRITPKDFEGPYLLPRLLRKPPVS